MQKAFYAVMTAWFLWVTVTLAHNGTMLNRIDHNTAAIATVTTGDSW